MPVLYGDYQLRPVQGVSIVSEDQALGDGRRVGRVTRVTVTGKIVIEVPDGVFIPIPEVERLSAILAKQAEIRNAFSTDGLVFEVDGWDGSPPTKFNAKVKSVQFGDGIWVETSDYTIELEGIVFDGESTSSENFVESGSESWQFERDTNPFITRATHSVSAKGKTVYDPTGSIPRKAWEYAKDFVTSRLGLGFNTRTDPNWSPLSGSDLAAISNEKPASSVGWNHTVQESVDEADGSYSVTETWLLTNDNYIDSYTVTSRRIDDPLITTSVAVSGTIQGLFAEAGQEADRYTNALARWTQVQTLLYSRAQAATGGINGATLNTHPVNIEVDYNQNEGSISYNYEFTDRTFVNDTVETYQVVKRASLEDYKTNVGVQGTITGAVYLDDPPNKQIKYQRAATQWENVKLLLYARAVQQTGISALKPFPVTAEVTPDPFNGTVAYSFEFDDRDPDNVRHEFSISQRFSREDARDTVTIEGTITGLREASPEDPFGTGSRDERFFTAKNYWLAIKDGLLGLAAMYVDLSCINPVAFATTVGMAPQNGTVQYSYEYTSMIQPLIPGALSEVLTISDEDATELIAIIPVPGRKKGPVIQDIGTVKEKRRTVSVEVVMRPIRYNCPGGTKPYFDPSAYAPVGNPVYLESDSTQWSPNTGRYTRNLSWIYE